MHVTELVISHFRNLPSLRIRPRGHVVLVGEPRVGRSNVLEALRRVLDADWARGQSVSELDFYRGDVTRPIEITATLGGLDPQFEQRFLDHLELWDTATGTLVVEHAAPGDIEAERYQWVLRLSFRAEWVPADGRSEERHYYPKLSAPDEDYFVNARRADVEALGFAILLPQGRVLDLGSRGAFRSLVERAEGGDFADAVAAYVEAVGSGGAGFTQSNQVQRALGEVFSPLARLLRLPTPDPVGTLQFIPEGGSASGLLRSLSPSIDLGDGDGDLPVWRRGSTFIALLRLAEALVDTRAQDAVLAVDDLGDGLDAGSAAHIADCLRRGAGQAWITTRLPAVAEVFDEPEIIRLGRDPAGTLRVYEGQRPQTKAESVAAKHWHRNLLPALSYRAVLVVEGPNDFAALHTLALRRSTELGQPLPAADGASMISAGMSGSGGYANVLKLAQAARLMGLRAVAIVDGDDDEAAQHYLGENLDLASVVIRLPDTMAIEAALVRGLPDEVLKQAIDDVAQGATVPLPNGFDQFEGNELRRRSIQFIKTNSLHSSFVDALPIDHLPELAITMLDRGVAAVGDDSSGLIQL